MNSIDKKLLDVFEVMMLQHIENLEFRILQYQKSLDKSGFWEIKQK